MKKFFNLRIGIDTNKFQNQYYEQKHFCSDQTFVENKLLSMRPFHFLICLKGHKIGKVSASKWNKVYEPLPIKLASKWS